LPNATWLTKAPEVPAMWATILKTPLFIWPAPTVTSFKSLQGSNFPIKFFKLIRENPLFLFSKANKSIDALNF
jgi:hypothetical protein